MRVDFQLEYSVNISYPIIISNGIFSSLRKIIDDEFSPDKCIVITDSNIYSIYKDKIQNELLLNSPNYFLISIQPGESSKSQMVRDELENKIIDLKPSRSTLLIALGGGVVGDLTGFLASTLLRGIRYVQVPTTILAQVDSSIGGKTGINTKHSKNLIGTFYHPKLVLIDTNFLITLNDEEYFNGFAEILKSMLIKSKEGFTLIENNIGKVKSRDYDTISDLISRSIKIKNEIVKADPFENGLRKILNFGHTIGHAIEALSNYQIKHGFAVIEGILVESYLSYIKNGLTLNEFNRIQKVIEKLELDKKHRYQFKIEKILDTMEYDKKKLGNQVVFSLLKEIGECSYNIYLEKSLIETALNI